MSDSTTPGWYPDPETGQQRYFDGQNWGPTTPAAAPPPPPPQKKKSKRGKIILGILAAAITLIIAASLSGGGDNKNNGKTAAGSAPGTSAPQTAPGIGSPVSDGKFEFVVTSVDRSKVAGDPSNKYLQETAKGEFVNVRIRVTNTGNAARMFSASNQKLIIGGSQYTATSLLGVPGDDENINPGLTVESVASFDVPPGAVPDAIVLHDAMLSGGVKVSLK